MRHGLCSCVCAIAFALSASAAPPDPAPRAGEAAPTTDQIYAAFDDADYAKVLRQIAGALAARGDAAHAYDRYELVSLRGETHLRLKNFAAAAAAFDEASRHTRLEEKAAVARATAELVRRAKNGAYTPPPARKGDAPKPLDVVEPAARRQAFALMFEGARPKVAAAVKAAKLSEQLPTMIDAFALLRDLRALELASAGEETHSAAMARDVGDRARAVMGRAVEKMGKTVAALEESASREVQDSAMVAGRAVSVGAGVAGLAPGEAEVLQEIARDCDEARRLTVGLATLYEPGGDEAAALRKLHDDAAAVAEHARAVMGVRWRDYYQQYAEVGPGAADADPSFWDEMRQGPPLRPGTNTVRRPVRGGNPGAGPRGVGTGGPR